MKLSIFIFPEIKNIILWLSICLLLTNCSRESIESTFGVNYDTTNRFAKNLAPLPGQFTKDTAAMDALINSFNENIEQRWGKDNVVTASKSAYVKYTDGYLSRSQVDFQRGTVTVETVASTDPKIHLHQAIVTTLLTPDDPAGVDLYSDAKIELEGKGKPFLYQQVTDHEGNPIEWSWRANRYADYLISNYLKQKNIDYKKAYYVEIPMVKNHASLREYKYADIVRKASKRYNIPEDLIYAIIRTESSFNPYAVSWANAYGLMQVVPKTAGHDVFKLVKNKSGTPTPEYLFNPINNIDTGTAYFHILKTRYLKEIQNPQSLEYSMISAYNGGAGGVLNTFDNNRTRALNDINNLQPNQVYWALTKKHKNAEARRYLEKVTAFKKEFNEGNI